MRALVQRVTEAAVEVGGRVIGRTGPGLLVLICAMQGDDEAAADRLAARVARLRIFHDDQGKMNRSLLEMRGGALVVSQFTLAADTRSGNRPGFSAAAAPEDGRRLYEHFAASLRGHGIPVETGEFGAEMKVHLVNDGPVTIWLETPAPGTDQAS
ncbi:D-aminoacyl-tRNA deacylase [Paracoccus marinaquae]|uniref:D-aminoacyl-tRNA deacylase n=1 Tax=Paracoccus marinaquae TaxID=2841926 RepID=A0ABS6AJU0_9RHOB|nr:D-aminoacyl-tRNA deacylase [Paracoccus marinaquae]MBU3030172.1 D-tyrosyl-tRNA(Tyr) deacylase [Paracoccus marinaquae]